MAERIVYDAVIFRRIFSWHFFPLKLGRSSYIKVYKHFVFAVLFLAAVVTLFVPKVSRSRLG